MSDRLHAVLINAQARAAALNARLIDLPMRTFQLHFQRFCQSIGMPELTPHQFRHTFATLALRKGHPIHAVATLLADTVATVETTYAHVMASDFGHVVNDLY